MLENRQEGLNVWVKGDPNFKDISRLTEPPVTKDWTVEDFDAIVDDPTKFDLRHVPCHTTPVERQVAMGTKVSKSHAVCEGDTDVSDSRFEQEMANAKEGHLIVPSFNSKQDYQPHLKPQQ